MTAAFRRPPPKTPEVLENHLVSLAYDLAEKQLRDGTASPTTINHFLKLGSTRAELERAKLENETALLHTRTDAIKSQARTEEEYNRVIQALKMYGGNVTSEVEVDDYDD